MNVYLTNAVAAGCSHRGCGLTRPTQDTSDTVVEQTLLDNEVRRVCHCVYITIFMVCWLCLQVDQLWNYINNYSECHQRCVPTNGL